MNKDLNKGNWIIPPWDSRYGKLGHLWKKYNYFNVQRGEGRTIEYFIPPELVINDGWFRGGYVIKSSDLLETDNWINRSVLNSRLIQCCNLDVEDFFNLIVLHNNSYLNTPRCTYCKSKLNFSYRFMRGYNSSTKWCDSDNHFCNHSCESRYHWENKEDYYNSTIKHTVAWVRGRELTREDPNSKCYLYIVDQINEIKFGLTSNLARRSVFIGNNYHTLVISNREEIANIEARLKLIFHSEYIDQGQLHEFFIQLKNILVTRPVTNPFD